MVLPEHIVKPQVYRGPGTWGPGRRVTRAERKGIGQEYGWAFLTGSNEDDPGDLRGRLAAPGKQQGRDKSRSVGSKQSTEVGCTKDSCTDT